MEQAELEASLNQWLSDFICRDANAKTWGDIQMPLADAEIRVEQDPGNPGVYRAVIHVRPHLQLESLIAPAMRLVVNIPQPGLSIGPRSSTGNVNDGALKPAPDGAGVASDKTCSEKASETRSSDAGEEHDATSSTLLDENVLFTAYGPRVVQPEKWNPILMFIHLDELPLMSPADEPHPLETVRQQAQALLGTHWEGFREHRQESDGDVFRNTEITFLPSFAELAFRPSSQSVLWVGHVEHVKFQLRAPEQLNGRVERGHISVFMGNLLLASIPMSVRVAREITEDAAKSMAHVSARRYRNIFASYSHKDRRIVEQCERYARTLGDRYLRDAVHLRAGENWSPRLEELIQEADVFQLFWSTNSMRSTHVEQEWRFALSLRRPDFVRPTYWEEPLPEDRDRKMPPDVLRTLHFEKLNAPRQNVPDIAGPHPPSDLVPPEKSDIHEKLKRVRRPRVHLSFDVAQKDAVERMELPFVVGVMGHLSGDATSDMPVLNDRSFIQIDRDNFDHVLKQQNVRLDMWVRNTLESNGHALQIRLRFESMQDFCPAAVARCIPAIQPLLETRRIFAELIAEVERSDELEGLLSQLLQSTENQVTAAADLGLT